MEKKKSKLRAARLVSAIACILFAAAMLVGCTKDDAPGGGSDDNSPTPVRLIAAIQATATPATNTRTAPGGTDGTQTVWDEEDNIGLFMLPAGGKIPADTLPGAHNVPYKVDPATGELTQVPSEVYDPATDSWKPGVLTPMYYPSTDEAVDFVAYYPYYAGLEIDDPIIGPYTCIAGAFDQTTAENQLRADYLYSDNARNIHRSKDAVELRFRHLMAKLRLDITLGEGFERGEVTKVTLPGMPYAVYFDMRNGSVNKVSPPSSIDIISCLCLPSPAAGTGATATFTAIVPPHEGAKFKGRKITVTVDGENYTGTIPDDHDYTGNTMYIYPVRVTPSGITIGAPTNDVPWTDGDVVAQFPDYDLTIANEEQLRAFAELVNSRGQLPNGTLAAEAKVLQTADITLTKEWVQIGYNGNPFRGAYNGDGHTITGLTITTAPAEVNGGIYVGLFGYAWDAVLTGIHLREVKINIQAGSSENNLYVGSIAGELYKSTLSLCSATGKVDVDCGLEDIYAGGIAGDTSSSTISRCRTGVEIKVATTNTFLWAKVCVGEIAGVNSGFILSCEAQGRAVTAKGGDDAYAGGITGYNNSGFIAFCRTGGNTVTAENATDDNHAGGLVGDNRGYLYSCYSRATATASDRAGAIVGENYRSDEKHCYGTGANNQGSSNLAATDNIVYNTSPGNSAIYKVVTGYTGMIEKSGDVFPTTTHYNSSSIPAHGIEKVEVKWGAGAWQHDLGTMYPEINMEYEGIPYNAP